MMKLLLALSLVALFSASMQAYNLEVNNPTEENAHHRKIWEDRPAFCKQYDCPVYKVENKTDSFELRSYNSARWLSIKEDGHLLNPLMKAGYKEIFKYSFYGLNYEQKRLPLATPFLVGFKDIDASWIYIEALNYAPQSFGVLPKPVNPKLSIVSWPGPLRLYVKGFFGNVETMRQIRRQRDMLFWELDKRGLKYVKESLSFAGYDRSNSKDGSENHYNEVWVRADPQ